MSGHFERLNVPYTIVECIVSMITITGNMLVLVAFKRERKLRRRTNYYIVSLAVADLLVGLIGIPCAVLASMGLPRQIHACLFSVSLLIVLCTISIFSLVAVSLDRYWAILHPMSYSRNVNSKFAFGIICLCWIMGCLIGFLPVLGWNSGHDDNEECQFTKVMDYNYLVFLYFTTIVGPAFLLAAFYSHIYNIILKQLRQMVTMNETGSVANGYNPATTVRILTEARRKEVKATQNLSIIVLFFIICWMPLYTINCVQAFCTQCAFPDLILNSCIVLSHLNSAGNPLLYAYRLSDFRSAFRGLLFGVFTSSSEHVMIAGRSDFERSSPKARPIISINFNPRKLKMCKDSKKFINLEKDANFEMKLTQLKQTVDAGLISPNSNNNFINNVYANCLNGERVDTFAYLNTVYLDVEQLQKFKQHADNSNRKRIRSAVDDMSYVLMINDDNASVDESTARSANKDSIGLEAHPTTSENKRLQRRHSTSI